MHFLVFCSNQGYSKLDPNTYCLTFQAPVYYVRKALKKPISIEWPIWLQITPNYWTFTDFDSNWTQNWPRWLQITQTGCRGLSPVAQKAGEAVTMNGCFYSLTAWLARLYGCDCLAALYGSGCVAVWLCTGTLCDCVTVWLVTDLSGKERIHSYGEDTNWLTAATV